MRGSIAWRGICDRARAARRGRDPHGRPARGDERARPRAPRVAARRPRGARRRRRGARRRPHGRGREGLRRGRRHQVHAGARRPRSAPLGRARARVRQPARDDAEADDRGAQRLRARRRLRARARVRPAPGLHERPPRPAGDQSRHPPRLGRGAAPRPGDDARLRQGARPDRAPGRRRGGARARARERRPRAGRADGEDARALPDARGEEPARARLREGGRQPRPPGRPRREPRHGGAPLRDALRDRGPAGGHGRLRREADAGVPRALGALRTPMATRVERVSPAYERVEGLIADDEVVILDGGNATELGREHAGQLRDADRGLWGTGALYDAPYAVLDVHRRYVEAGCDVVSTNTWAILAAAELEAGGLLGRGGATHWMDVARLGVRLARRAVEEAGRTGTCAVALSGNGDVDSTDRQATLELLLRVFEEEPPDLVLMETMSLIREGLTMPGVELVLETGLPVWLSFRRCRHGVCGVYGQHWGGPEGDVFGRAARSFEELGVAALLVNCLPPDHVPGMLPWLRDFVDLPLGVYPNLGYYSDAGWRFDPHVGPEEYAELALAWRAEGAQIVGGCCGTSPQHLAAAKRALAGTTPGRPRSAPPAPEPA